MTYGGIEVGRKGQVPWNKGMQGMYSKETLEAMRIGHLADFETAEAVKLYESGLSLKEVGKLLSCSSSAVQRRLKPLGILRDKGAAGKGRSLSAETKKKMSDAKKEYWSKPENRAAFSGPNNHFYGKKHKPESIEIMKQKLSIALSGENNPQWRGGLSLEPYGVGFTRTLKRHIKERDNYTCQICGALWKELDTPLYVHHIDYDKTNHCMENLVTLCSHCHGKTVHDREYWIAFFEDGNNDHNTNTL